MHPAAPAHARLIPLDWLRIGAFGLLMIYHVGMFFVPWDWHVKASPTHPALEPWMRLSNPWRMGLLFVLSGLATGWMLHSGRLRLRERSRRLLLPLLTGVVLIVPPQAYWEVVDKHAYTGSYGEFLRLYFSAYGGFCQGSPCLVLPTWNHLWFLPYLWCYTALWLAVPARWREAAADRLAAAPLWALALGPALGLALLRLTLFPVFGSSLALVDDAYNHAVYGSLFGLGALMAQRPALLYRLVPLRGPALAAALLAWALMTACFQHVAGLAVMPEGLRAAQRVAFGVMQWAAIVAALGFALRHLQRDHPWRAPLNEAVFPCYLVHQTLIIALAVALRPLGLPAGVLAALLGAGTLAGGLIFWQLARRSGPLRPWLGLTPRKPSRTPTPGPA